MKAADRLGTGSSFNKVPRGRSDRGRAKAITQGDVPAYELVRLRLNEVAPTPLNPRRNFGTDDEKSRFGEELRAVQLAACVAVSRDTYLGLWPEHSDVIGKADYVLVNGERRYRSADHVGLDALDFVVRNDLAASREDFVDFLLKENLDREDFDLVERARGVQALVAVCADESDAGSQTRAAERLGMSKAWVTNQLALLILPVGIQEKLSSGELPEREGRLLARHFKAHPDLNAADLMEHLALHRESQARKRENEKELLRTAKSSAALTAVNAVSTEDGPVGQPTALTAVNSHQPQADEAGASAPVVLTAVNTEAPSSAPKHDASKAPVSVAPTPAPGPVVPHQESPVDKATEYVQDLMKELGDDPTAQARAIASALSMQELSELISALRTHM